MLCYQIWVVDQSPLVAEEVWQSGFNNVVNNRSAKEHLW